MDFTPAWAALQSIVSGLLGRLPYLFVSIAVFVAFYFAAKGVRILVRRFAAQRKRHRNLGLVLGRLSQALIVLIGLLIALVIVLPGFTPGQLLELLGIGSVAIGFAFRDILQNFLAGILILLTEPFRIGDQIVVNAYEGTVEDIQTRATTITTYDGRRVVIPNASLFTNSVTVNTAFEKRRLQYDVGIGYGDDIERARELILEAMTGVAGVLRDPAPDALVVDLGPSSVLIRARWWIEPPRRADALHIQDRVLTAVKDTLTKHGIDLPFPTQQILLHDQTEETDGDRRQQREGWPAGNGAVPQSQSIASMLRKMQAQRDESPTEPGEKDTSSHLQR
jgi:small conductance mechanosensitive channel